MGCPAATGDCEPLPDEALVEVHVRSARLTDLDAAVRLLAHIGPGPEQRDDVDYLRNLLYVPSATIIVAEADRKLVGVGVLAIRPSVRSRPFVGIVDELGVEQAPVLNTADRKRVTDEIVEHLTSSARNKGCTRVEVTEPLASAEPSLWKRMGFASRGRTLGRSIA